MKSNEEYCEPGQITTNSIGMSMAYIPPGVFLMGSPSDEEGRGDDEGPQHHVKITRGFYMGVTPVTQAQWAILMGNNPSRFKVNADTYKYAVQNVTYDGACDYCKILGEKESGCYRLPTEAEWEYACRACTTTPFNIGATLRPEQTCINMMVPGSETRWCEITRKARVGPGGGTGLQDEKRDTDSV